MGVLAITDLLGVGYDEDYVDETCALCDASVACCQAVKLVQ